MVEHWSWRQGRVSSHLPGGRVPSEEGKVGLEPVVDLVERELPGGRLVDGLPDKCGVCEGRTDVSKTVELSVLTHLCLHVKAGGSVCFIGSGAQLGVTLQRMSLRTLPPDRSGWRVLLGERTGVGRWEEGEVRCEVSGTCLLTTLGLLGTILSSHTPHRLQVGHHGLQSVLLLAELTLQLLHDLDLDLGLGRAPVVQYVTPAHQIFQMLWNIFLKVLQNKKN